MDSQGHIYYGESEQIPAEDKARLDGYLRARAEVDKRLMMESEWAALEAEVAAIKAER